MPNGEIFQKAEREQRIVLTFDLDFGEILAASSVQIVGVILFRLRYTRTGFAIQRPGPVSWVVRRAVPLPMPDNRVQRGGGWR